jgi:O-antigen/teichoic acid export membrane protein
VKVVKSLSVYTFILFLNAAVSFFIFSIITHKLTAPDLGIIYLYSSFTIFLVPFIGVGIQFLLSVDYFKMDASTFKIHFKSAIFLPVISVTIFTGVFFLLYFLLPDLVPFKFFFTTVLPISCFLVILNEVFLNLVRNKERNLLFAAYSIGKNLVEVGLTVLLVVIVGMNWQGRLWSMLITAVASAAVILYFFKRWELLNGAISRHTIKSVFISGISFVPERIGVFVLAYSAVYFINFYKGTHDVGYYGVGMQIATIVNISIIALMNAFHPYIYKNLAGEPRYENVKKATLAFIGISFVITVGLILALPVVFKLFIGKEFQSGQIYARYLAIGYFFWSVYAVFLSYLLFLKKNKTIMAISVVGMSVSIALNFFNVRYFGALGATYTNMGVNFMMAVLMIYFVHKNYDLTKIFSS